VFFKRLDAMTEYGLYGIQVRVYHHDLVKEAALAK